MSQQIVLYDLGRRDKPNTSWSFNVWKTRLALNYKNIPYSTHWLDHNTSRPTLAALGLPPNKEGFPYTVPTAQLPDGSVVTDSAVIALRLEELYPTPSLNLNVGLEAEVERAVHATSMPIFAIYMPRVTRDVIDPSTVPAFQQAREKRFGMTFEEMEKTKGGEKAWQAAEPGLKAVKALLNGRKIDDGPFILGSKVCYADFYIVAMFETLKRVGADMFERALAHDESFKTLYEASSAWLENDK